MSHAKRFTGCAPRMRARAGQLSIPASRAASLHSASSTDAMLAEGFLDLPGTAAPDLEAGGAPALQPLITPSGMGAEMRCAPPAHV